MLPLRLLAPIVFFALVHVALYRTLCGLWLPRPDQARLRGILGALMTVSALFLPLHLVLSRQGMQWSPAQRWLVVYPLLTWNLGAIFLLLGLGSAYSIARRWPSRPAAPPASGPPQGSALGRVDQLSSAPPVRILAKDGLPPLTEPRRVFLARAATTLTVGSLAVSVVGWDTVESAPEVTHTDVFLPNLHADLDGLVILQLSDIHSGSMITEERMRKFAAQAGALAADLVVFTGDQLDSSPANGVPFSNAFRDLKGKLGTFVIFGNHDYFAGAKAALRAFDDAGLTLLRNAGVRLERGRGTLYLGGIDDPTGATSEPRKALRGAAPEEPKLMLAHRPSHFHACAQAGAQLVLSGHTHGGQVAFSRTLTAARLLGPYTMGDFAWNGAQLHVHRGMGVVGVAPMRLGVRPELALLTLRKGERKIAG